MTERIKNSKIYEFINKNFEHILFLLYIIITVIITIFHEPWRDEAQAWLIARDLSFVDIIKQMQYEGHPCLWHLILAPFAKLGLPFYTISIINLLFMFASVWLILYKTELSKKLKVLFILSAPFIYYYPVIARCYSLMCFLTVLITVMYKSRKERTIIFAIVLLLLTNTHVIMAAFVGMIFLTFYIKEIFINKTKDKKIFVGAIIVFIGFILLLLQVYASLEMCSVRDTSINNTISSKIYDYVNDIVQFFYYISPIYNIPSAIGLIISIIIAALIFNIPKNKNDIILIFWISFIYIVFVDVIVYNNAVQRSGIVILLLLFLIINYKIEQISEDFKNIKIITTIICIISAISGIQACYDDIIYKYSCAKDTAEFISENCSDESIFVSGTPDINLAIIPFLNNEVKFYNLKTDVFYTYATWDYDVLSDVTQHQIINSTNKFVSNRNVYYIHSLKAYNDYYEEMEKILNKLVENGELEVIYDNSLDETTITRETYTIYKIKGIEYDK